MSKPKDYKPLAKFLSVFLGSNCEILLCDTEKFLHIENPLENSYHIGDSLDDLHQKFLNDPNCNSLPYTMNYRTITSSGEKLRSATFFIRDQETLTGFLTINWKMTEFLQVRDILDNIINGTIPKNTSPTSEISPQPAEYYETLSVSVSELISSVMSEARVRFQTTPDRFTAEEKLSIVREMDKRGVFLVKGSVSEVAKEIKSSEATIYRYLHQINNK